MGLPLPVLRRPGVPLVLIATIPRALRLAVAVVLASAPAAAFPFTLSWKRLVGSPPPETVLEAGERTLFAEADGTVTAVGRADGRRQWRARPGGPVGPGLACGDSLVYVADRWGHIAALHLGTGAVVWSARRTGWGDSWAEPSGDLLVVAGGEGIVYGLEAATGAERWRVRTGARPRGQPAVAGGRLYAATAQRQLIAVDLGSGRRVAAAALDTTARFVAAAAGRVWVAGDQELRAYDGQLRLTWSRWLGTALTAPPRLVDGRLVAAGANGYVYALNAKTGAVAWSARLGAPAEGEIAAAAPPVLVAGTSAGDLVGLGDGGRLLWREALCPGSPARVAAPGARLYASGGDYLYAFDPVPAAAAFGDTLWWEGRAGGAKTGYGWGLWRAQGGVLRLDAEAVGWHLGFVRRHTYMEVDEASLAPLRIERVRVEGSQILSVAGTVSADTVRFERRLGDSVERSAAALPAGVIAAAAIPRWIGRRQLQEGQRDTVLVLDDDTGLVRPLAVTAAPDSAGLAVVRLRYGEALPPLPPAAADLPVDLTPELEVVLRVDAAGREASEEVPALGVCQRRVEAAEARTWVAAAPPPKLHLDAAVPDATRLDSVKIGLPQALGDPARLFVLDDRQRLETDSTGVALVVYRQQSPRRAVPLADLADREDLAPYLAAGLHIPSHDPRIRALAAQLVPPRVVGDSWEAARILHDWVYDNMVPADTNVRFKSALEVLDDLEGTCSEYAVLFAALCRAAGIPARMTVGYAVASDGELVLHIWPQVYVGEWVEVDPSWNAFPVDAAHIKTGQGLLHPAHLERLNLTLEWIGARADTLPLLEYGGGGQPRYLAAAQRLHEAAERADRQFDEAGAQAARQALAALPWNRRSGANLVDLARSHLDRGELDECGRALDRLDRLDPDGPQADAALLYRSRLEEQRGAPARARELLERLVERYPAGDRADDALVRLGQLVEKEQGCARARPYYERLAEAYAGSGWAAVAESALRRCAEAEAPTGADAGASPP